MPHLSHTDRGGPMLALGRRLGPLVPVQGETGRSQTLR
jgi:hypothetical protein